VRLSFIIFSPLQLFDYERLVNILLFIVSEHKGEDNNFVQVSMSSNLYLVADAGVKKARVFVPYKPFQSGENFRIRPKPTHVSAQSNFPLEERLANII